MSTASQEEVSWDICISARKVIWKMTSNRKHLHQWQELGLNFITKTLTTWSTLPAFVHLGFMIYKHCQCWFGVKELTGETLTDYQDTDTRHLRCVLRCVLFCVCFRHIFWRITQPDQLQQAALFHSDLHDLFHLANWFITGNDNTTFTWTNCTLFLIRATVTSLSSYPFICNKMTQTLKLNQKYFF